MQKAWRYLEFGFAAISLGVVTVALIYAFKRHSEGAAAWVQAIGAIAAIAGAFTIARAERHAQVMQAEANVREEHQRSMKEVKYLLSDSASFLTSIEQQATLRKMDRTGVDSVVYEELIQRLNFLRRTPIDDGTLEQLNDVRDDLVSITNYYRRFEEMITFPVAVTDTIKNAAAMARQRANVA
ncbi:hypothetical protein PCA20602_02686 [Pandoraea capi]|uniref:LemA family protein n=1 Tax=Pandoraea capi TaxID=2508286 RepID=A0ABY6W0P2_9BURK|nr:hypothetical protein [Pandoraea capi]VVE12086.1 hypothetical protein PCA20602_02686 [Pandoraea capi]